MRNLQIVLCILTCLCVLAAVIVGAFWYNLGAVLGLMLAAVIFGGGMFIVRGRANAREEEEARKHRPDFMNTPSEEKPSAQDEQEKRD